MIPVVKRANPMPVSAFPLSALKYRARLFLALRSMHTYRTVATAIATRTPETWQIHVSRNPIRPKAALAANVPIQ